jgi:hypothetical protein
MTNEEINIAIAEVCGYEWVSNGWGCRFFGSPTERSFGSDTQSPLCEDAYDSVPNYCNDLNAMHEGERSLNSQHVQDYTLNLLRVTNNDGTRFHGTLGCFAHVHATAKQRAEAFLKTIGKWEEQ